MKKSDFYYDLPEELIAQTPIEPRDHSKMLVVNRENGNIEHKHFYDIVDYLSENDVLVVNNTRVIPARLYGKKKRTEHSVFPAPMSRTICPVGREVSGPFSCNEELIISKTLTPERSAASLSMRVSISVR